MISSSDSINTLDLDNYYAIIPNKTSWKLDEYIDFFKAKKIKEGFSYNSGTNSQWETVQGLRELIKKHVDENFEI